MFEDLGKGLALGFTTSPYRSLLRFLRFPGRITKSGEPARSHFSHLAGDHRPDCAGEQAPDAAAMVTPVDALLNNSVTGRGFSADCTSQPVRWDSGWGNGERGSPFAGVFAPAQACPQECELERRKGDSGRCAGVSRLASREILQGAGGYITPKNWESSALHGHSTGSGVRRKGLNQGS